MFLRTGRISVLQYVPTPNCQQGESCNFEANAKRFGEVPESST